MAEKTKVYHVGKRASDGKWTVKFAGGEKVIKTFATKAEAEAYVKVMAENIKKKGDRLIAFLIDIDFFDVHKVLLGVFAWIFVMVRHIHDDVVGNPLVFGTLVIAF